jgi:hypothetical protein
MDDLEKRFVLLRLSTALSDSEHWRDLAGQCLGRMTATLAEARQGPALSNFKVPEEWKEKIEP